MTSATLLVELLTEELPPKALPRLGQAFSNGIVAGLRARGLATADGAFRWFATPRRLAVTISNVVSEAAAKDVTEKIMPVSVALTADGQPTPALGKKLEAKGIPLSAVASFERRMDGKAEVLFYTSTVAGAKLADVLGGIVQDALKQLPIPKVMRWGDGDATFVRPAHKLTLLHGADVVPGSVLDIQSGRTTKGHRFMSRGEIEIATADGQPTPALGKKLEAKGIPLSAVASFERRMDGKAEALFYTSTVAGAKLADVLGGIVQDALKQLPIPKVMRWGDGDATFVRPAHKLTLLHGADVVPGSVLDIQSGRTTKGHRFMSRGEIEIATADAYEPTLLAEGKVIPDFAERRANIEKQLVTEAGRQGATLGEYADLLEEVTALVEHPTVYVGEFEAEFLAVPQECLILTMRANQKYFPLFDADGKLLNRFLIVSNMELADPSNIITGNQRVVRPRLSDARFFFEQDIKAGLTSRVVKLDAVVYHNKLGSLGDRVQRLSIVARKIAGMLGADENLANRAALLSKADLLTDMVGEFPELQGTMGRYYALAEGAFPVVAEAIEQHYRPRFAGDALPDSNIGRALALADKLDSLTGFFGIGQIPTGDKDPFGLRRAALGVLRILMEAPLPLDLASLIKESAAAFPPGKLGSEVAAPLYDFMLERLRNTLRDAGHSQDVVDAVLALKPTRIDLVVPKLDAVLAFQQLPEAAALAAANKRIVNILKKAEGEIGEPDVALLVEDAEKALFHAIVEVAPLARSHFQNEAYTDALRVLAGLRAAVDRFFDEVMVMAEEPLIRQNRLALLNQLAGLMNQVADISRLSA